MFNIDYFSSGSIEPDKKFALAEGTLNPSFTGESETPRYIRPTQPPPTAPSHPYYTGAEIVRTPQQAISMMDKYRDDEDHYDVIEDVIATASPDAKQDATVSSKPSNKLCPVASHSSHLDEVVSTEKVSIKINDEIYYSPFENGPQSGAASPSGPNKVNSDASYNDEDTYYNSSDEAQQDGTNYQGLSTHEGSHSYETMSPSPHPGRSIISGHTTYSLVNDPDNEMYYSDVVGVMHDLEQVDDSTYSDVEL